MDSEFFRTLLETFAQDLIPEVERLLRHHRENRLEWHSVQFCFSAITRSHRDTRNLLQAMFVPRRSWGRDTGLNNITTLLDFLRIVDEPLYLRAMATFGAKYHNLLTFLEVFDQLDAKEGRETAVTLEYVSDALLPFRMGEPLVDYNPFEEISREEVAKTSILDGHDVSRIESFLGDVNRFTKQIGELRDDIRRFVRSHFTIDDLV